MFLIETFSECVIDSIKNIPSVSAKHVSMFVGCARPPRADRDILNISLSIVCIIYIVILIKFTLKYLHY